MKTDLNKLSRIFLAFAAVIGIIASVELLLVYYNANFNPQYTASFCAVNEYINCDSVAETEFSRLFNIPLSLWGLGFYVFIQALALFPFHKFELFKHFKHPRAYIFSLATFAVLLSLALIFISSFVIKLQCPLCYVLYLVNFVLLIASKPGNSFKKLYLNTFSDIKNIFSDKKWVIIIGIAALIGIIVLVLMNIYTPFTPSKVYKTHTSAVEVQKYHDGFIGNVLGAENAEIVIHKYTNFQCPYCAMSHKTMLKLVNEFDDIRVEHHDMPFSRYCNPYSKHGGKAICNAIYYAKAAKNQGKYWDMVTLLYENSRDLSEENILKLAKSIDLNIEQLKKDASNTEKFQAEIKQDIDQARKYNIHGTPFYVIGYRKYRGMRSYEEFREILIETYNQ